MAFSAIIKPSDYFNTKLYTGNGSTNAQTGVGFQPDFTWLKNKSASASHALQDAVRGNDKTFKTNTTAAQFTQSFFTSFNSDGFTVATTEPDVNASGNNYVAWNWKANGQGSSNTDGTINSTYTSASTTSGFSIVSYTGNGTSGATVGHGLGVIPQVIIVKRLNATDQTIMYHHKLNATPQDYYIRISDTGAASDFAGMWNDTAPTSSLFSIGNSATTNANSEAMIAYCFAEKQGYSKFGSYAANANVDGPFIYTGFSPAFVLLKQYNTTGSNWMLFDDKREGYNIENYYLHPDTNASEGTTDKLDLVSNGFKIRTTGGDTNSGDFIYMAFAKHPFVANSGESIPTTAR